MNPLLDEPAVAFLVRERMDTGLEIRVNFGVYTGRHATPAEIDELAVALREFARSFAILSEERHEFGGGGEASVHQVVVEVPHDTAGEEPELLAEQIVLVANDWARECSASRHGPNVY